MILGLPLFVPQEGPVCGLSAYLVRHSMCSRRCGYAVCFSWDQRAWPVGILCRGIPSIGACGGLLPHHEYGCPRVRTQISDVETKVDQWDCCRWSLVLRSPSRRSRSGRAEVRFGGATARPLAEAQFDRSQRCSRPSRVSVAHRQQSASNELGPRDFQPIL